mgnify:CR=1 FL=1
MKKCTNLLLGLACLLISVSSSATLITNDINILLPTEGSLYVDLDGDLINDIGLAEDCCEADNTWTDAGSFSTEVVLAWLSMGDVVDGALAWTGDSAYMDLGGQVIGANYIAVKNTSVGDFFGYITLDYDGTDLYLSSFTYDDSGRSVAVSVASIPEPTSIALFGLALVGFVASRTKKKV